jgi:hypothetical protein
VRTLTEHDIRADAATAFSPPAAATAFSLPAIDDPASTEAGVIILGLEVRQLLAGLGFAALADDPAAITLLAEQARHAGEARIAMDDLLAAGVRRWHAEREALGPLAGHLASPRRAWAQAYRAVEARHRAAAMAAYLTACWLRRAEVDSYADACAASA